MTRLRKSSPQTIILLAVLLEQPRTWRHGYDLCSATSLKSGTLYPILMRLSDRGMLDSRWESAENSSLPPRHMYRLSIQGLKFAKQQLTNCDAENANKSATKLKAAKGQPA